MLKVLKVMMMMMMIDSWEPLAISEVRNGSSGFPREHDQMETKMAIVYLTKHCT
jgi:hypothetical protein